MGPSAIAGTAYFGVTQLEYLLSNAGFLVALSILPLALAPLSESYGRRPVFLWSLAAYTATFVPVTLLRNYPAWAVFRTLSGATASVANSMAAGSVTDLYVANERGSAMNSFALAIFAGQVRTQSNLVSDLDANSLRTVPQAIGPIVAGWVSELLDYRWLWGVCPLISL
jgi:MFS family permease